ncbi:MAG: Uma2 family endonuclease [Iamia sp.]
MELALPPEWDITFPDDRPLTVDDYLRLPEGPPNFELIDGAIVVNPVPVPLHARIASHLTFALMSACPPGMEVFGSPVDWVADDHNVLEPDVSVCEQDKVGEKRLYLPPVLCVEILSPSTRRRDLTVTRGIYERGGVTAYWVIDPVGPRFLAWDLDPATGRYVDRADLVGEATFDATIPYPVTIDVAALIR